MDPSATNATDRSGASSEGPSVGSGEPQAHPLEPLLKKLTELCEFALNYAEARKDKAVASARIILWQMALTCLAFVCAIALIATSLILTLTGLSQIVGEAMGGRAGVGEVVVGGGTILCFVLFAWIRHRIRQHKVNLKTKQKYERRHRHQQTRFGETVVQRASS